jgi:hypothetical protein
MNEFTKIPYIFEKRDRILVIGDIHGDFRRLVHILVRDLGVIDEKLNWIAEPPDTVIVQMGDQVDSCRSNCHKEKKSDKSDDISVLKFMTDLHIIASKKGGMVLSLLGNHELMNVQGNFDYVSRNNNDVTIYNSWTGENDKVISRRDAFRQGGVLSSFLATTRMCCVIIGSWVFVHGGYSEESGSIEQINSTIYKWLMNLTVDDDLVDKILNDEKTSIFWNRAVGKIQQNLSKDSDICRKNADPFLKMYPGKKLVVGHTIQDDGITSTCGTNIYRVDTAISSAFDEFGIKKRQVMEIIEDKDVRYIDLSII